jgi:ankyrin repeat protein
LIDHHADPEIATNLGTTPLMLAAECAFEQNQKRPPAEKATAIKTVKLLVEHGAKVNRVGQFKLTAMHCAATHGMNDVIRFLASKGADLNLKDDIGETPLSIASAIVTKGAMAPGVNHRRIPRDRLTDTAALLLQLGATPNEKSGLEIARQS